MFVHILITIFSYNDNGNKSKKECDHEYFFRNRTNYTVQLAIFYRTARCG